MAATAANESWKPASKRWPGRVSSRITAATPSVFSGWDERCSTVPPMNNPAMTTARTTDAFAPVSIM